MRPRNTDFLLDGAVARHLVLWVGPIRRVTESRPLRLLVFGCTCFAYALDDEEWTPLPCDSHAGRYEIVEEVIKAGPHRATEAIRCNRCGLKSYNPADVEHR